MRIYFFDLTHFRDQGKVRQFFSFMSLKNWRQENCFWYFLTCKDHDKKDSKTYLTKTLTNRTSHLSTDNEQGFVDNQMNQGTDLISFTLDFVDSAHTSRSTTDNYSAIERNTRVSKIMSCKDSWRKQSTSFLAASSTHAVLNIALLLSLISKFLNFC